MAMEDMDTMDTMVRGQLRQSQGMATMVMDMAMDMDTILVMAMDTMDTMARGQLKLNLAMDIMVMDMDMAMAMDTAMDMVMVMVMAMVMDTMDKSIFMLLPR